MVIIKIYIISNNSWNPLTSLYSILVNNFVVNDINFLPKLSNISSKNWLSLI